MSGAPGGWGGPGFASVETTTEKHFLWGPDAAKGAAIIVNARVSGTARDDGNTPTTVLRPGLVMGKITSTGELAEYDPDATDGTQYIEGVLQFELRAQDFNANNTDRVVPLIVRAPLIPSELLIEGTALTSSNAEWDARRQLVQRGCIFEDDPGGRKAGARRYETVSADTTVVGDDNGTVFVSSAAADVNYTLPTIAPGLEFEFVMGVNQELAITSAAGGDIVAHNDVAANSITYTTTGEQIGASIKAASGYLSGTLKWFVHEQHAPGGAYTVSVAT